MQAPKRKHWLTPEDGPWDQQLARRLVRWLPKRGLHPNHITTCSLILGVCSAALFAKHGKGQEDLAAFLFALAVFLDHLDGEYARLRQKISYHGFLYDYIAGGINYTLLFLGISFGFWLTGSEPWFWLLGICAGLANPAVLWMHLTMEKQLGKQTVRHPSRFGVELEDFIYLIAPWTWLFGIESFFVAYSTGTLFYLVWTILEYRKCQRRRA